MADDTVASLGFEVSSKPLDDAKTKLKEVATEAGNTGKAVDAFNQSVSKTGDTLKQGAAAATAYAGPVAAIEAAAKRAGVSTAEFSARMAAASTAAKAAGAAHTDLGNALKVVAPALSAVGTASQAVAKEHEAHNNALGSLRTNLRAMSPLLSQFGGGLGEILSYSKAARLGLEGLALVAGGAALLSLQKISDEVERSKNRFAGLTGSAEAGAKAYDAVRAAAKASGAEVSAISGFVDKAIIAQDKFADKTVIYANTADRAANKAKEFAAAAGTVGSIMQGNLATADEQRKVLDALGKSFEDNGKLTVAAFRSIQDESSSTALAIARAFGYRTVQEFVVELDKGNLSLTQFVERMKLVDGGVKAAMDPTSPKTFEQSLRGVTTAWDDLVKTIAKAGGFDVVKDIFKGAKNDIEALKTPLETLSGAFIKAGKESEKSWSDFISVTESKNSLFGSSLNINVDGALLKTLAILGRLPSDGVGAITSFVNDAISQFGKLAAGAVSAAQTVANALSGVAKQYGGALNQSVNNSEGGNSYDGPAFSGTGVQPQTTTAGNGFTFSQMSSGGNDPGAVNYGGGSSDYGYFATGGQFTVAGSGGTDSQTVSFKATPGEVVTVATPDQQGAAGVVSATPGPAATATVKEITDAIDQSAINITKEVTAGSDNIVTALKQLIGGVASATVNPATGLSVSSTDAGGRSLAGLASRGGTSNSAVGGGGFNTKSGGGLGDQEARDIAQSARNNPALTQYQSNAGVVRGQATPIYGFRGQPSQFPSRTPVNPNYNQSYNFNRGFSDGAFDYLSGSGYASVGRPATSAFNDYGLDYGGNNGSDFGVGGSTVTDVATQFMSSSGSSYTSGGWGNDPGSMDYGGGSADMGYFATGGQFKVGGDGGTDTTKVRFHATKGETVTITPPGMTPPPSGVTVSSPSPSSDSGSPVDQPQSGTTHTEIKTINMYLHSSVTADQLRKSRAQWSRAF